MAAELDLGNLLAHLSLDAGDFQSGIKNAENSVAKMAAGMDRAFSAVKHTIELIGVSISFGYVIKSAMEAEDAITSLNSSLKITGVYTKEVSSYYRKFAEEMQKQTVFSHDEIETSMAMAHNIGITTGRLEEATKAAIGLASAYDMSLSGALMLVARASQGSTAMLKRHGIIIQDNLTPLEKYNELLRIGNDMFSVATERAGTTSGSLKQLKNAISDVAEEIGGLFLPYIKDLAKTMKQWLEENTAWIKKWAGVMLDAFVLVKNIVIDFVQYLLRDFPGAMNVVWDVFVSGLKAMAEVAVELGLRIGQGLYRGIVDGMFGRFDSDLKEQIKLRYIKMFSTGDLSPEGLVATYDRAFKTIHREILGGLGDMVEEESPTNPELYDKIARDLYSEKLAKKNESIWKGFGDNLTSIRDSFVQATSEAVNAAKDSSAAGQEFADKATGHYQNFLDSIAKRDAEFRNTEGGKWSDWAYSYLGLDYEKKINDIIKQNKQKSLQAGPTREGLKLLPLQPDTSSLQKILDGLNQEIKYMGLSNQEQEKAKSILQARIEAQKIFNGDAVSQAKWVGGIESKINERNRLQNEQTWNATLRNYDDELSLIGLTQQEQEKTNKILQLRNQLEQMYGQDIAKYNAEQLAEYNSKMEEGIKKIEDMQEKSRGSSAFFVQIKQYGEDATNMYKNMGEIAVGAFDRMGDELADMLLTGKANFKDFARSVITDITRMIIKWIEMKMIMMTLDMIFPGSGTALSMASGAKGSGSMSSDFVGLNSAAVAHSGGIVGKTPFQTRMIPMGMFNNAPRLHAGLMPDETAAILQRGEMVIPKSMVGDAGKEAVERPVLVIKAWDVADVTRNSRVIEDIISNAIRKRGMVRTAIKNYV